MIPIVIPIQTHFRKKELSKVLNRLVLAHTIIAIGLNLIAVFTLWLFRVYAEINIGVISYLALFILIGYSFYFLFALYSKGFLIDAKKSKKYKPGDFITLKDVLKKGEFTRFYILMLLYLLVTFSAFFSGFN